MRLSGTRTFVTFVMIGGMLAIWKSGDFLVSEAPPVLITFAGGEHLVIFGGGTDKMVKLTALFGVAVLVLPLILAQAPPDFSGTWKLDTKRSRVAEAVGFAGLVPKGAPGTLHITQPANGTLIIESQINEGHSRIYRPGGKTSTPSGPGAPSR